MLSGPNIKAPAPFSPQITHHDDNTVANLKKPQMELLILSNLENTVAAHLRGRLDCGGNRTEGSLQVGNRHTYFFGFLVA